MVEHREGGDPSTGRKSPGRTKYEAITLERGVTHDTEFENWANKVWNFGSGLGAEVSLKDFRKDIIIEVYNEAGQLAIAYKVFRCWVSEFQALPDLDANANAVAIQTHQARERRLGARLRRDRARRAHASPSRHDEARCVRRVGPCDRESILTLWERAVGRSPLAARRRACWPAMRRAAALGARNARAARHAQRPVRPRLAAESDCPACETRLRVRRSTASRSAECLTAARGDAAESGSNGAAARSTFARADGRRSDAASPDDGDVAERGACAAGAMPARGDRRSRAQLTTTSDRCARQRWIERLDPAAPVTFELACPACGDEWSAPLDVGEALWRELQRAAERSLTDIDALARAYGWTEDEVMGLSPIRRAAYLQLVGGVVMRVSHITSPEWRSARTPAGAARPSLPSRFAASPLRAARSQGPSR